MSDAGRNSDGRDFSPDSVELKELTTRRGKPLDVVINAVGKSSTINAALQEYARLYDHMLGFWRPQ